VERPLNLLLVDGNPREADLFRQSLMSIPSLPCRLDWVADAEAGLEAILENRHNVCFVDQVLGPSTGTALIKEALKRGARRPLILNSGREDVTLGAQAIAIGAVDWLVKDEIEPFTLEKTVRSALERDRIRSENARIQSGLYHSQRLESLGLMASGIAHDFNNILSIILASAELGLRQAVPGSEGHGYLSRIRAATERAAELSHHMLTYSGRSGTQPQALDLAGLARETAEFCRAGIPRRVRLNTALPSALPAVHCDPTQIRQVLVNLLNNASDAIEGEGRVDMDGRLASVGEDLDEPADFIPPIVQGWYVVIRIADDGCGMDAGRRERIFDPFFTTKSKGRGLGLASALGIINSHKGSLRVRSAPGRGIRL
jgi:signal transduction histidine kinase